MSRVQNEASSELDDDIAGALDNPLSSYYAAMHPEIIEKAKERTYWLLFWPEDFPRREV